MASRQSASKSAKPVTASPTSKPVTASPTSKPTASKPTASKAPDTKPTPAQQPAATPSAAARPNGNGAAARKQAPSKQAPGKQAAAGRGAGAWAASGIRAVRDAVVSALRATVDWCGGGLPFATILFSVLGLADSVYLTVQHFSTAPSFGFCPENKTINCLAVTTSEWSRLPAGPSGGIPVSVAGLAFFVFMVAINSRWGWRARWAPVHWARLAAVLVGILLVLYLIWAELFRIDAICLYCTGVHIITFILFALIISRVVMSGVQGTETTDNG